MLNANRLRQASGSLPAAKGLGPRTRPYTASAAQPLALSVCTGGAAAHGRSFTEYHWVSHGQGAPDCIQTLTHLPNRQSTRAEVPRGACGRAPPASQLPACAAQAGATASLSPSDAARAGAGGARAPGPQRAARGLCCQSRGPGLSSRHLQRLRRPEVTVSEAARRCPVSMFSGWRSYAQ